MRPLAASGIISQGPTETLVSRTIDFIFGNLTSWRDDPLRPQVDAEDSLNLQLCDYLDIQSRERFSMVRFSHQEPQHGRRKVDLAAKPTLAALQRNPSLNIYEPVLVIEGKRMPAPSNDREKEYVSGDPRKIPGGMQRFKLGLHGIGHSEAVMIGYVQSNVLAEWFRQINVWILEIAQNPPADGSAWDASDQLLDFTDDQIQHVSRCTSCNSRTWKEKTTPIRLHHLWINLARIR